MSKHNPEESVIGLLGHMVQIDSVNSNISGRPAAERPLAEALEKLARAWGLATQRLLVDDLDESFNLLITLPATNHPADRPWLLFESHMDVVSVANMDFEPFCAKVENGKMLGRGTCDTKSSGAAMLWTLKELLNAPVERPNNCALLFVIDEEISKRGIRSYCERGILQNTWRPDLAIVGEPTLLSPIIAHNGVARLNICTRGESAHSSRPERGHSAISSMVHVIEHFEKNYIPQLSAEDPLTGKARCSINLIQGGKQINIIPSDCEIGMDRRIVPTEDYTSIPSIIENELEKIRKIHPEIKVALKDDYFLDPPMKPLAAPFIDSFFKAPLQKYGIDPTPCGESYGTDGSNLTDIAIPTVVLGPGDIAQAHTSDEWVELDQVTLATQVYKDLALQKLLE
ncbi:MAG: M20/M25/M40 family metallo-hydrolase [Chthoniobacterales bacterium]